MTTVDIKKATILIIDDEAIIRDGSKKILTKSGWNVEAAENGSEGLRLINKNNYDLILLDLMMPGMSGIEVISEVKKINPNIYIVVITGYATVETAVEAMKMGAYEYISKPFTPDQLRLAVKKALGNRALQLEAEFLRREQEKGLLAIAQEKSKVRTIVDSMPNGVLVINEEKKIALNNPMACKLLNIDETDSIGQPFSKFIKSLELSDIIKKSLEPQSDTDNITAVEIEAINETPLMVHVAPVKMENGKTIGTVAIFQDISHQKSIDKMKADFIAKVTHELKTPAATINQLLMTLMSGVAGELKEDQIKMLERAKLWGDDLLELVSDLLNISKFESGLAIHNIVSVDLKILINDVIELIKPQADKKNISIITEIDNLKIINADRGGIKDVLTNLISNAVKYSEDSTEVVVKGSMSDDAVKISVIDHGYGISEKDIPLLFERFFRVKNQKTRHIMGTGLGLPIVKEIIEAHKGSMDIKSREGEGSTFTVTLPVGNNIHEKN